MKRDQETQGIRYLKTNNMWRRTQRYKDPKQLISVLNIELIAIDIWIKTNKLSVNIKKASYIIFKPKQKLFNINFPIVYDNQYLKQEQVVKFLGVYISENLTYQNLLE